jgi:hypothetical protein
MHGFSWIQQLPTPHMILSWLWKGVFGDRMISCSLWSPHSTDLTLCDFYLWGNLKDKVYRMNPYTNEELKENLRRKIWKFLRKNLFG